MTIAPWTLATLKLALDRDSVDAPSELSTRMADEHGSVLLITMTAHGDLEIYVNVSATQITASALLWPCDDQPDRNAFNDFLLRTQKVMPLSNFGIVEVNGRDYYELCGELATTSPIDTVFIELRTLAENAIAAATDLHAKATA